LAAKTQVRSTAVRKRHPALSAVSLLGAVALSLAAVVPASLALGAAPASAASCWINSAGVSNCAPANVNFRKPGSVGLSGTVVCGIENDHAPLASAQINRGQLTSSAGRPR
jgi:ABC-type amino acid transport substrate-binding protein